MDEIISRVRMVVPSRILISIYAGCAVVGSGRLKILDLVKKENF